MFRGRSYESVNVAGMHESKKVKRYRSAFTTSQINYLEKQFKKCPYIGSATRKEVANVLSIPERAIKIWFQNRRMKEKKEMNNAEYNINNHNNITNDTNFAKDSLINAHSSQSTNDRECSLRSNVTKHVETTNSIYEYYDNFGFPNQSRNDLKKISISNYDTYKFKGGEIKNIKQEVERTCLTQPTNTMKYNLNDKYDNKNFINYLEFNKNNGTKNKVMPKTTLKAESFVERVVNVPSTLTQYQDLPEDLSARNLSNVIIPQNPQANVQFSPAYIPFCNTQDVCISAGNVIWKPVNVMPTISSNAIPVTVSEKQPINQECKCNCTCQSKNRLNFDQGNVKSQPQYVIAIPYNNNLNILR